MADAPSPKVDPDLVALTGPPDATVVVGDNTYTSDSKGVLLASPEDAPAMASFGFF